MNVEHMIQNANHGVPKDKAVRPMNCHEAALGWVLMGRDNSFVQPDGKVERAWTAIRELANTHCAKDKQLTGRWMAQHIYNAHTVRVQPPFNAHSFDRGDVVFMGDPANPHHSMIIVEKQGNAGMARGFNNAGAFGAVNSKGKNIFMEWDEDLRDLTDPTRWNPKGEFLAVNGPCQIHKISFAHICGNIPLNLHF